MESESAMSSLPVEGFCAVSLQEQAWELRARYPSRFFGVGAIVSIVGNVRRERLTRALSDVVSRHEILHHICAKSTAGENTPCRSYRTARSRSTTPGPNEPRHGSRVDCRQAVASRTFGRAWR